MSERIATLKQQAKQAFADKPKQQLKYGLTIRLNTKGLRLEDHQDPQSTHEADVQADNCDVTPLFETTHADIEEYLHTARPAEHTRFDDYNHAHASNGLFVRVPQGQKASLTLTRNITGDAHVEHVLVVAHENSELTLIDKQTGDVDVHSATVEVIALDGAHVRYSTIESYKGTWDLVSYRARAMRDAKIDWFAASLGTATGFIALGVAYALSDMIEDTVAGVYLLRDPDFAVGDTVAVGSKERGLMAGRRARRPD